MEGFDTRERIVDYVIGSMFSWEFSKCITVSNRMCLHVLQLRSNSLRVPSEAHIILVYPVIGRSTIGQAQESWGQRLKAPIVITVQNVAWEESR